MTPIEKLDAAIAKLEKLRDGEIWMRSSHGIREATGSKRLVSPALSGMDTELILLLHRTIDAQLEILRRVLEAEKIERYWETLIYTQTAIGLADAILGEVPEA